MKNTFFAAIMLFVSIFAVQSSVFASGTPRKSKPKSVKVNVRTPPPVRVSGITEANGVATDVSAARRVRSTIPSQITNR